MKGFGNKAYLNVHIFNSLSNCAVTASLLRTNQAAHAHKKNLVNMYLLHNYYEVHLCVQL